MLYQFFTALFFILGLIGIFLLKCHFDEEKIRTKIWSYINNLNNARLKQEFAWTDTKDKKRYSKEEKKQHIFKKYERDTLYYSPPGSF